LYWGNDLAAGWAHVTRRTCRFQPLQDGCEPETTPKGHARQAETARNRPYFLAIPMVACRIRSAKKRVQGY
jgi:hypothetical protein